MSPAIEGSRNVFLTINERQIQGLLQASLATNNCFSSDSFSLTFAIGPSPLGDLQFWSTISGAYVEISTIGRHGLASQTLITGMVDSILIDPIRATVAIEGRDLSSTMIDSYRQQDFVNQSASEVVSIIAQHHGLAAVVIPTSGSVGRYYGDGYTRLSLGQFSSLRSDWDLVVQLARENEFDVFVSGRTLFFQPATNQFASPIPVHTRDLQRIRVQRTLAIMKGASVRVQSWNSRNMASYDSNRPIGDAGATSALSSAGSQAYLFSGSNFTSQQVADSASRYSAELGRLAQTLHLDMPWDFSLVPRCRILLCGTNSALDVIYQIDSVERHYNSKFGSTQSVVAVSVQ